MKRWIPFLAVALLLLAAACGRFRPTISISPTPTLLLWTPVPYPVLPSIPPTVTPTPKAGEVISPVPSPRSPSPTLSTPSPTPEGPMAGASLPPGATPTPWAPTPTWTPSSTTGAMWTPVVPIRPGPVAYAYRRDVPPTLDGRLDDWQGFGTYPIVFPTYGRHAYRGPEDVSGHFHVAWDPVYLYLAFHVMDDVLVQEAGGRYLYRGDSTEILVDADLFGDRYVRFLNHDDYQLGFSPGQPFGQAPFAWLWYPRPYERLATEVQVAVAVGEQGYDMEVAVPWGLFHLVPYPGLRVGFAASISDNDRPGTAIQQTLVSSSPYRRLTDPTTWGELVLYPCGIADSMCPRP